MAWGSDAGPGARGGVPEELVDPHGGFLDLRGRLLRAVGDPDARFREDALRMLRAIRLAAALDFEIEPSTFAGIRSWSVNRHRPPGASSALTRPTSGSTLRAS